MGKHFFITGGTGLVGTALVPEILGRFPDCSITLLVRAKDAGEVQQKIEAIARRIAAQEMIPDAARRLRGVKGDVTLDDCGLPPAELSRLTSTATHIIHGAATIRFDHPIEEARAINFGGTRRMLAIAQKCADSGQLERFAYIGTSSVSGRREGAIYEDELEMGQEFFNTYEQSKCESERLVREHFRRFPVSVFRPSIIIGDSRTGWTSTFNVVYIPLKFLHRGLLSSIPAKPETLVDLVPVDWVSEAIAAILSRKDSAGLVFHITAGTARAAPLGELLRLATEYFNTRAPLSEPRRVGFMSVEQYRRYAASATGHQRTLLAHLEALLPYITINRLFDSRNADRLLEGSGIEFPAFEKYAGRIFGYCLETDWGKRAGGN